MDMLGNAIEASLAALQGESADRLKAGRRARFLAFAQAG
jgi:hypothetical protein